jgi:N-methylhydantoinase A/oxoprolinase/acetone carboxylase beta subunit
MSVAETLNKNWVELEEQGVADFQAEGVPRESLGFKHFVFMQYLGQLSNFAD